MKNSAPRSTSSKRCAALFLWIVVPCLLIACASNNVVVQPLAPRPVAQQLMEDPKLLECAEPQPVNGREDVRAWVAHSRCVTARGNAIYARLTGLQRAVRVREKSAAKAVKASKI